MYIAQVAVALFFLNVLVLAVVAYVILRAIERVRKELRRLRAPLVSEQDFKAGNGE